MMFLRHGMFARKGIVERRRKLIVGGTLGLLLVLSIAIYAIVKAAGSYNLDYVDATNKGLTNGDIWGTFSKLDNSEATNVDRDGEVKLNLEFKFADEAIESAKTADAWTYDLSSLITDYAFIKGIKDTSDPIPVAKDDVVIASYTVSNGQIIATPLNTTEAQDWWNSHQSNVRINMSVILELDKTGVALTDSSRLDLPGTSTPEHSGGYSAKYIYYTTPHAAINARVYDEASRYFKTGDNDKLVSVAKEGNNYVATYNANFYTDAYTPDLQVRFELEGNQSFAEDASFVMTSCTQNDCIHDSGKTTITIPSEYVRIGDDGKTAKIHMPGFLYDYCEQGGNCASAGIDGYTLNNGMQPNNANGSDFYIEYKTNLGETNPAGNNETYRVTASIFGGNGSILSASDSVKYSVGLPGSKTATCVDGSTTDDGKVFCNENSDGNYYIDYAITVGDADTDLSKTMVIDKITDNQIVVGDITLTAPDSSTTTIALTDVCVNEDDNDCVVSAATDANYSNNQQKLFSHAFAAGDMGPWMISYRVKIATDAKLGESDIDNIVDLKLDQTTYADVWKTSTKYEFASPVYIEKVKDYTLGPSGYVHWTIRVYGPISGDALSDVQVTDRLRYDASQYPMGKINVSVDSATVSDGNTTTATSNYGTSEDSDYNLVITIPTLGVGEMYSFGIVTAADEVFRENYGSQPVVLTNQADRASDGYRTEELQATIFAPDADDINKTAQEASVFYWNQNPQSNNYEASARTGYLWTVTINPEAGSVSGIGRHDYEPYFSDVIPEGLYLSNQNGYGDKTTPVCKTEGACDADADIDQASYWTTIDVVRTVAGQQQSVSSVPVSVGAGGVIEPINLAALFNDPSCDLSNMAAPSLSCAGIDNAVYEVTYATAIADEIYNDLLNEYSFTNQAKLYEQTAPGAFSERDNAVDTVVYRNSGIIAKDDTTAENLDSSNKINYVITVNEAGYAYKNDGQAYESGATRPMLTVTDRIPNDVNLSGSISCANASNVTVNDCVFDYDSETRVLTVQLPDGYARKIRYSVVVANPIPNERSEYVNTAILNLGTKEFESTVRKEHVANSTPSYAIENGTMRIKKVNSANINEAVSGAKFRLTRVEYDAQGNLGTETVIDLNGASEGTDGTTSSAGAIKFENLCGYSTGSPVAPCSNGGQLYYWQEVSVPAPYVPVGNMTKHYFVLYDEASLAEDTQANRAVAENAANIIMENGNNNIAVEVLKSNYEWVVSNIKQVETTLAIEKQISGNTARVEDVFTIKISATDLAGEPLNGSYASYVYLQSDRTDIERGEPIVFTNGEATVTLDHGRGILIDGFYVGGSYEITEPSATGYEVNFACTDKSADGGCDSETSNTGTFVADTNTGQYPTVADAGQSVILTNDSSTEITGISDKKPSAVIAVVFGSTVSILGVVIARRFRH